MRAIELSFVVEYYDSPYSVVVDYTPSRPAPWCSNPDDPAFSDPGDPAEIEIVSVDPFDKENKHAGYDAFKDEDAFIELIEKAAFDEYIARKAEARDRYA